MTTIPDTDTDTDAGTTARPSADAPGPVAVVGATGKTGRRVVDRLTAVGVPVLARSRRSTPRFDWTDRSTWAPALAGARGLYLTYVPDLAVDGAPDDVAEVVRLAAGAGVEHVVLLSGRGESNAVRAEDVVASSGLAWTVVRASWFVQNLTEGALHDGVLQGAVVLPTGGQPEPFVDADDIADVVVAALTEPGHAGRLYEVTGPRALTFAEAVAEVAAASGRSVEYVDLPPEAFREAAAPEVGQELADLIADLCTEVFDGRNVEPADGVRQALGREPRDLVDVVRAAAAAGAWR